jgi:hypothetical protein
MEEWERFKVGKPSVRPRWEAEDCVSLTTVTHSSHVGPALAIINDGEIRPSLVYDNFETQHTADSRLLAFAKLLDASGSALTLVSRGAPFR